MYSTPGHFREPTPRVAHACLLDIYTYSSSFIYTYTSSYMYIHILIYIYIHILIMERQQGLDIYVYIYMYIASQVTLGSLHM